MDATTGLRLINLAAPLREAGVYRLTELLADQLYQVDEDGLEVALDLSWAYLFTMDPAAAAHLVETEYGRSRIRVGLEILTRAAAQRWS